MVLGNISQNWTGQTRWKSTFRGHPVGCCLPNLENTTNNLFGIAENNSEANKIVLRRRLSKTNNENNAWENTIIDKRELEKLDRQQRKWNWNEDTRNTTHDCRMTVSINKRSFSAFENKAAFVIIST